MCINDKISFILQCSNCLSDVRVGTVGNLHHNWLVCRLHHCGRCSNLFVKPRISLTTHLMNCPTTGRPWTHLPPLFLLRTTASHLEVILFPALTAAMKAASLCTLKPNEHIIRKLSRCDPRSLEILPMWATNRAGEKGPWWSPTPTKSRTDRRLTTSFRLCCLASCPLAEVQPSTGSYHPAVWRREALSAASLELPLMCQLGEPQQENLQGTNNWSWCLFWILVLQVTAT